MKGLHRDALREINNFVRSSIAKHTIDVDIFLQCPEGNCGNFLGDHTHLTHRGYAVWQAIYFQGCGGKRARRAHSDSLAMRAFPGISDPRLRPHGIHEPQEIIRGGLRAGSTPERLRPIEGSTRCGYDNTTMVETNSQQAGQTWTLPSAALRAR
jgi:hypothetical protein